jgi:single-stranded DNA-binding protein
VNRIELSGRLCADPELRITPAGTPVLRIVVECGEKDERMELGCVMTGEQGRELARRLRRGSQVRVSGRVRPLGARASGAAAGFEVAAGALEVMNAE